MDSIKMRDFWDDRAREDAFHFVDNREPYQHPDTDRFWREGERDLGTLLRVLELEVGPEDRVLDVGCGIGRLTRVLAGRAAHVVLQHIPSAKLQLGYIAEFGRVLKPGGWAAFGLSTDPRVHEPRTQHSRRGFLKALVGQEPAGTDRPEWLGTFVPLDALGATAVQAGLELERIEGANTQFTLVRARATGSRAS